MNIRNFHALAHKLYNLGIPRLPKIIYYIQDIIFNSSVPYKCKIGKGTVFGYGDIAVVVQDVPSNCVAAGIPAKIIKSNININEIEEF